MNKRRFDVAINNLPEYLKITLRNSYEDLSNPEIDQRKTQDLIQSRIRRWTALSILALILTFCLSSFFYFLKHRKTGNANIFKAIKTGRRTLKELPSLLKEGDDNEPQKSHIAVHDNTEDEDSSSEFDINAYIDPTAASKAVKDTKKKAKDNKIEFDENIHTFHRLQNGNTIVQNFDNTIEIINSRGVRGEKLPVNAPTDIAYFGELENGDIVAIGTNNNTNDIVLIQWGNQPREVTIGQYEKVTAFSVKNNIIGITVDRGEDYGYRLNPMYINLDLSNAAISRREYNLDSTGKILLVDKDTGIFYSDFENEETLQILKIKDYHFDHVAYRDEYRVNLAICTGPNCFVTTSGKSNSQLAIWQLNPLKEISPVKTVSQHLLPITLLATSPDEKLMLSCDFSGVMCLWDTENFEVIKTIDTGQTITNMFVNNDGEITVGFGANDPERGFSYTETIRYYNRVLDKKADNKDNVEDVESSSSTGLSQ